MIATKIFLVLIVIIALVVRAFSYLTLRNVKSFCAWLWLYNSEVILIDTYANFLQNELEATKGYKGEDQYKPIIKVLKAIRKAEKYRIKSQIKSNKKAHKGKGLYRPYPESSESSESSEEWHHFGGPYQSSYPGPPPNFRPNRPNIFESSASSSSGGNGGNGGSGNGVTQYPILQGGGNGVRFPNSPSNGGGNNGGGSDPIQQINQGFGSFLQGLGSLTLGQLLGFPSRWNEFTLRLVQIYINNCYAEFIIVYLVLNHVKYHVKTVLSYEIIFHI